MKRKKDSSKMTSYLIGIFSGAASAAVVSYMLNISGVIVVSSSEGIYLTTILRWFYQNLGLSIIPFALIAAGYSYYLNKLVRLLKTDSATAREIFTTEEKIDLLMNIFLGIGVIWTAIGMRNALLASLGNMDAGMAAQKGAFYILTQLVEGGILLSLSTTIAGGLGGYTMRVVKAWSTGHQLNAFMDAQVTTQRQDIFDRLDSIALLLKENNRKDQP